MTAQKPPDKTLVGMPADLKAVLEKLDQATADKSAFSDPPRQSSAFDANQARPANRPRTVPPPLPASQGTAPPSPPPQDPTGSGMDRTLIGMPADMQAALARAIAEQANAPVAPAPAKPAPPARPPALRTSPAAAGPALLAQPVRAIGVPSTPASEAQVSVQSARGPAPTPKPTAVASYQPVPPRAAPTYVSGLGYQPGQEYQDPSQRPAEQASGQQTDRQVLAPEAPLDWPPTARRSDPGPAPVDINLENTSDAAFEQLAVTGTEATQLALSSDAHADDPSAYVSRLALPLTTFDGSKHQQTGLPRKSNKRWLAIALGGLGLVALAGLGAWLAPKLLPGLASGSDSGAAAAPVDAPTLPAAPATVVTDTAAASDPVQFTPTPTRPPAAPAMTSGPSAQLEKKAIERLIVNDYPAAKQLYEKLRSAEPTRPEFTLMVELLSRAGGPPCGEPGQAPCAGAQP
jgi:hypothetical protein